MTDKLDPRETGLPGTTEDPNQANLTEPDEESVEEDMAAARAKDNHGQPGTTRDPNQANRT